MYQAFGPPLLTAETPRWRSAGPAPRLLTSCVLVVGGSVGVASWTAPATSGGAGRRIYAFSMGTRERLMVESARLFAERGYHGTSINDLAAALGIQKSSVYTHIKGKEDLLAEIAFDGDRRFHQMLDELPVSARADDRLRMALEGHLGVVQSQLHVSTVWLQEWRCLTGVNRRRFLDGRRRYSARVKQLFRDAVEAGHLRDGIDLERATLVFLSIGNWAYTWLGTATDPAAEAVAFWAVLMDGVAAAKLPD